MIKELMLLLDLYSLLPAFTLMSFLIILLWPENIPFKSRLKLIMVILILWVIASILGVMGYGTSEKPLACFVNAVVGVFGLIASFTTFRMKPTRRGVQDPLP